MSKRIEHSWNDDLYFLSFFLHLLGLTVSECIEVPIVEEYTSCNIRSERWFSGKLISKFWELNPDTFFCWKYNHLQRVSLGENQEFSETVFLNCMWPFAAKSDPLWPTLLGHELTLTLHQHPENRYFHSDVSFLTLSSRIICRFLLVSPSVFENHEWGLLTYLCQAFVTWVTLPYASHLGIHRIRPEPLLRLSGRLMEI